MNQKAKELLNAFEALRPKYIATFKSRAYEAANKLKNEMANISRQLHELGVRIGIVPINLEFIQRCLDTSSQPDIDNATATAILRDALGCFEAHETEPQRVTYRGFLKYTVDSNGLLSLPEPSEQPEILKLPPHPCTRNADLVERNFNFSGFTPPDFCIGTECENIHCRSRRDSNRGNPCTYAPTTPNK
jgi:hypothetical protein